MSSETPKLAKPRPQIAGLGARARTTAPSSSQPMPSAATPGVRQAQAANATPKDNKNDVWTTLKLTLRGLNNGPSVFPMLGSVVDTLISSLDLLSDANECRRDYRSLASRLTDIANSLKYHLGTPNSTGMSNCICNLLNAIQSELSHISEKQKRHTLSRFVQAARDEEDVLECYRRIESHFRQLEVNATLSIWSNTNEQLANMRLDRLSPAMQARYNSAASMVTRRRKCTPNTRINICEGLHAWANAADSPQVYWLNGMAGTGKTTIVYSICEELEDTYQLGASFFCSRLLPDCRDVTRIMPTIAYQLASFSYPFRSALCDVLGGNRDFSAYDVPTQFDKLVKQPLLGVVDAMPNNVVIAIDALDELSGDGDVKLVLDILLRGSTGLPVRFLVSSRPDPAIREQMLTRDDRSRAMLHLHDVEQSLVQADIETYLIDELRTITPSVAQIRQLSRQAGSLFIYAATAVRYILPDRPPVDPYERLNTILQMKIDPLSKRHKDINALYSTVLAMALEHPDLEVQEVESIQLLLRTVICVKEPMNVTTLANLLNLDESKVRVALQPLWSVLHVSESTGVVSTLHASFPDYMLSRERSDRFWCDEAMHSKLLAQRCFEVMVRELRFNICSLESSFISDEDVPNLSTRIERAISPQLFYASQHWSSHLQGAEDSSELRSLLNGFLTCQLLFWMEVLNVKRCIGVGGAILGGVDKWLANRAETQDMRKLVDDAQAFVAYFAINVINRSTPHIYISMLPFWPKSRPVSRHYTPRSRETVDIDETKVKGRSFALAATWDNGDVVSSVAVSPDGSRVASGCKNGSVSVRDARTGTIVARPSEAYVKVLWSSTTVWSMAFSPDSARLAFGGSGQCTLCVWDVHTGTVIAGPCEGHTGPVVSLAFSCDGARIASGADDCAICVWDSWTGMLVAGPLEKHVGRVTSVTFSSDDTRLISGSSDGTIYVWDLRTYSVVGSTQHPNPISSLTISPDGFHVVSASHFGEIHDWDTQTGSTTKAPFEGHDGYMCCTALSQDGTRMATDSEGQTVCVRDAQTGALLAGPLEGHTDIVSSVAFFPNGTRIASGSHDGTVRIWDVKDVPVATKQFEGHTLPVLSVAFSPNGAYVASCSGDCTVRIWEALSGAAIAGPFIGHEGTIFSIAFSPDGSTIASGSTDRTIRIWDAHTGRLLLGPLQGHEHLVSCMAFSPDGARMVSGSFDRTIRVWDTKTGLPISGPPRSQLAGLHSVAFSRDGSLLVSTTIDSAVCVWNTSTWSIIVDQGPGEGSEPYSAAFLPDGVRVFSGSVGEGIRIRSTRRKGVVVNLSGDEVADIGLYATLSPDGKHIASCYGDHSVNVWDLSNKTPSAGPFKGHTKTVQALAFSPDGALIASGSVGKNPNAS